MVRIFVGNLDVHCNESLLRSVFETYGTVEEVSVTRNCGFVVMANLAEAEKAIRDLGESSWFLQPLQVMTPAKMAA